MTGLDFFVFDGSLAPLSAILDEMDGTAAKGGEGCSRFRPETAASIFLSPFLSKKHNLC